jgi:hypothetical protein
MEFARNSLIVFELLRRLRRSGYAITAAAATTTERANRR